MSFNKSIHKKAEETADLVISKQHDYGKGNILACPVGPEIGLIVRLTDKLNRLANLYKTGQEPSNESLRETWIDIAGYGLIGVMLCDDNFKEELE